MANCRRYGMSHCSCTIAVPAYQRVCTVSAEQKPENRIRTFCVSHSHLQNWKLVHASQVFSSLFMPHAENMRQALEFRPPAGFAASSPYTYPNVKTSSSDYFPDYVCQRTDQLSQRRDDCNRGAELSRSGGLQAVFNSI